MDVMKKAGLLVGIFLLDGFILQEFWKWFVVTTFNVEKLSIQVAIGLVVMVRFICGSGTVSGDELGLVDFFKAYLARSLSYLAIGFVTYLFIL